MKSHGLLFTIALPAFFFNLHYLKFFSSMSYSFQSTGLSPHWLNLFLDTFDFFYSTRNWIVFLNSLSDSYFLCIEMQQISVY